MGLWGTDADATDNKPKNLTTDTNSDYAKKRCFRKQIRLGAKSRYCS